MQFWTPNTGPITSNAALFDDLQTDVFGHAIPDHMNTTDIDEIQRNFDRF